MKCWGSWIIKIGLDDRAKRDGDLESCWDEQSIWTSKQDAWMWIFTWYLLGKKVTTVMSDAKLWQWDKRLELFSNLSVSNCFKRNISWLFFSFSFGFSFNFFFSLFDFNVMFNYNSQEGSLIAVKKNLLFFNWGCCKIDAENLKITRK